MFLSLSLSLSHLTKNRKEGSRLNLRGAVVAQWIRPRTLNSKVPGSNLLAAAGVPLGKALYPHCLVPWKGLEAVDPLVVFLSAACYLCGHVK